MKKLYKVAVDGPAGSGKSSISKQIAIKLGIKYIDSGALYRTITHYLLQRDGKISDNIDVEDLKTSMRIEQFFGPDGKSSTMLNGADVSELIRSETIVKHISFVSDNVQVRTFVNFLLRKWAESSAVIMDGRDIGSVVFPDADAKIYLDASVDIRASRRVSEYSMLGKTVDLNEIKNQIIIRDDQDRRRPFGALVQASDAIYVDTSGMTKEEVIEKVSGIILDKISKE